MFIDGCYWHGCPQHFAMPATNLDYWGTKIGRNQARDLETTALLEERGWLVLRFWEHEPPEKAATIIREHVQARRAAVSA